MFRPIILCGGSGTRLWPLSQKDYPKQFTTLFGNRSLLQHTYDRCVDLTNAFSDTLESEITILTSKSLEPIVQTQLYSDSHSLILEPDSRDTGPAICATALLSDPKDLLLICPADHYLPDHSAFANTILKGIPAAQRGYIVTFGIQPEYPETGYGYIEAGENIEDLNGVQKIVRFREKPNLETAEEFIEAGHFFWNSGIFLFQVDAFLKELLKYSPHLVQTCQKSILNNHKSDRYLLSEEFCSVPKISIDYALMEKTSKGAVVTSQFIWSDVGSWKSVYELSEKDDSKNGSNSNQHRFIQSYSSYVRSSKPVTLIGVSNLGVIETDDEILVLNLDCSQKVKDVAK